MTSESKGSGKQVVYASLAIYSPGNREGEISRALKMPASLVGERRGTFSWIYSTKGDMRYGTVEQHLQALKDCFAGVSHELSRFAANGCDMRIWIYFETSELNTAFVLEPDFIAWLSSFGADVCVDVWR